MSNRFGRVDLPGAFDVQRTARPSAQQSPATAFRDASAGSAEPTGEASEECQGQGASGEGADEPGGGRATSEASQHRHDATP